MTDMLSSLSVCACIPTHVCVCVCVGVCVRGWYEYVLDACVHLRTSNIESEIFK